MQNEQIAAMRNRLSELLLKGMSLARSQKENQEQVDALTNYLAGVDAGEKLAAARYAAEKAAAEKAAAENAAGTAKIGDQEIPLIDDTGNA